MKWYLKCLRQYADFGGRARRKEYWMFVLFNVIFTCVAIFFDNVFNIAIEELGYGPICILYMLGVMIPGLSVTVRRLHDTGKSGWWIFINLIPIVGSIWLLVLLCTDGDAGENQYGQDPKGREDVRLAAVKKITDEAFLKEVALESTEKTNSISWQEQKSNGTVYFSCKAETLYRATEILRDIPPIARNIYYVVDTPDGSLGRDIFGFYTEKPLKSSGIAVVKPNDKVATVDALSLTAFGDAMKNQSSVAMLKSTGQYANFVLQMECGHCGYKSPVETVEGQFDRQCYSCGTINHTTRGKIIVGTQRGLVEI
jgi:uncharacterized membrane protein YhaH (DUF805 family)